MGSRERKRAERTKRKARSAEQRFAPGAPADASEDTVSLAEQRAARSEARNQEVRQSLEPLAEGERPAIVTIGALISVVISASVVIAYLAGAEVDGERPNVFQVIAPAAIFAVTAYGMWKARYWAVLGFQAIALIIVLIAGLNLTGAQSVTQAIGNTVIMVAAGAYFWFGVKAMARIQMPERP